MGETSRRLKRLLLELTSFAKRAIAQYRATAETFPGIPVVLNQLIFYLVR